ncbi:MAG TPA: hypothetical protein VIO32_02555 [Candidatus Baltobacteraceae bacterium]
MLSALIAIASVIATLHAADAAQGGLNHRQLQQLRAIPFAVVPDKLPPGFRVDQKRSHIEPAQRTYTIVYTGPGGATIIVKAAPSGSNASASQSATPSPRGLFQKIGRLFRGASQRTASASNSLRTSGESANKNANSNKGPGETEEEMNFVSADSPFIGPTTFRRTGKCDQGWNDATKASGKFRSGSFEVDGCNMRTPDALVGAYRALAPIH